MLCLVLAFQPWASPCTNGVLEPNAFLAVRVTVNVPVVAKTWPGFCSELVVPSPKVQDHEVGFPVEVSENCTFWFTAGEAGDTVKAADGMNETDGWDGVEDPPPQPRNARVPSAISNSNANFFPNMTDFL